MKEKDPTTTRRACGSDAVAAHVIVITLACLVGACSRPVSTATLNEFTRAPLYTCCNIHYEYNEIYDANFYTGGLIPLGTPVSIHEMYEDYVWFFATGMDFYLYHSYASDHETGPAYFAKLFVHEDPRKKLEGYSPEMRETIRRSRVERGMNREQVLLSIGYPPAHMTPNLESPTWYYLYNDHTTYDVHFGADGRVRQITGGAPTEAVYVR